MPGQCACLQINGMLDGLHASLGVLEADVAGVDECDEARVLLQSPPACVLVEGLEEDGLVAVRGPDGVVNGGCLLEARNEGFEQLDRVLLVLSWHVSAVE